MLWLGERRGYLSDWVTQRWVQATGRRVSLAEFPWLEGPVGRTRGIGRELFSELAREEGLVARREDGCGLLPSFALLASPSFDPSRVAPAPGAVWARYLPTMRESIRVYPDGGGGDGGVRTDHVFIIWRHPYLRLHYRLATRLATR
jgi:hypothetical protein